MTCDTCAAGGMPEADQEVLENLGLRVVGPLTVALAELAELTKTPKPVWMRAADRFSTGYLSGCPTDKPVAIGGKQLDRQSIAITNASATTTDVVWIGATFADAQKAGHPAYPLYGGKSLTIPTTAEVWVYATATGIPVAWVSTELDLP